MSKSVRDTTSSTQKKLERLQQVAWPEFRRALEALVDAHRGSPVELLAPLDAAAEAREDTLRRDRAYSELSALHAL